MYKSLIDQHFDEQLTALGTLIAFPSVSQGEPEEGMPLGRHIHNALTYTLDLAREMGFSARSRSIDAPAAVQPFRRCLGGHLRWSAGEGCERFARAELLRPHSADHAGHDDRLKHRRTL